MITITPCGAVGEVTGSGYLVETSRTRVLVDFGMFQGVGATDEKNAALGPVDPRRLDAVVLTHAHLDHTGRLPVLVRAGYAGPIFGTAATIDFTDLIISDSGRIQEADAARANRVAEREGRDPVEPLYTSEDVSRVRPLLRPIVYDTSVEVAPGITVRLVDAGHILGSASIDMTVVDGGVTRTIAFSGDVGPPGVPFLRDPVPLERADVVLLESTYGDRDHRPLTETVAEFREVLLGAIGEHEKVLIPAFAIGRSQQILYYIAEFMRTDDVAPIAVYLDSPMAIRAMKIYRTHDELFDEEATALRKRHQLPRDMPSLHLLESADQSRALNDRRGEAVIIAGAGMCDGGRIVHHLKHNLWRRNCTVMLVGYMAEGTLGRELVEGAERVEIHGRPVRVRATIRTLGGFSAHAGRTDLLRWASHLAGTKPRFVLTHGEDGPRAALADALHERFGVDVARPMPGDVIEV